MNRCHFDQPRTMLSLNLLESSFARSTVTFSYGGLVTISKIMNSRDSSARWPRTTSRTASGGNSNKGIWSPVALLTVLTALLIQRVARHSCSYAHSLLLVY